MTTQDASPATQSSATDSLVQELGNLVGREYVNTDAKTLLLAAQDIYRSGHTPLAVVTPADTEQTSAVVKAAHAAGAAIFPRGGGMSYTDAHLPTQNHAIILDTSRLNKIRKINAHDLYVTVEAGCTWYELQQALAKHSVRTTFWGPMSGRVSTIGGAVSQGAVTLGSARNGSSITATLGLEIVLADGSVMVTGSASQPEHSAFYREYGPDMTGIFCADSGSLGIKTAITLRLEPLPTKATGLSYSFNDFPSLLEAVRLISRHKVATEIFGAETRLVKEVAGTPDLMNDARQMLQMVKHSDKPFATLAKVLNIAKNGRSFLDKSKYLINFLTEADSGRELNANIARIRELAGDKGVETANTVAIMTQETPFPDPMVLGPGGRRLLPLHTIVPYSKADALQQSFDTVLAEHKQLCEKHNIDIFVVYATCGTAGFLWECVIYWPDEWLPLHEKTLPNEILDTMKPSTANPDAQQAVDQIKESIIDLMYQNGGTHYQIGRTYPYTRNRNDASLSLLKDIKSKLDPDNIMNPGVFGL